MTGYWGPVTATLDWCEANYEVSAFIAEFWNTLTNLTYVLLCLYGLYSCYKNRCEARLFVGYFGLLFIGVGSWCFHATLQYEMQLLDELPMIYVTCVYVYCGMEGQKKIRWGLILPLALFVYSAIFTWLYINVWRNPVFHQVNYGILVFLSTAGLTMQIRKLAPEQRTVCKRLFVNALGVYLLGFLVWNIDNIYCGALEEMRAQLGAFSPLLQLHGWWHVFTGIGTYAFLVMFSYVRALVWGYSARVVYYAVVIPVLVTSSAPVAARKKN